MGTIDGFSIVGDLFPDGWAAVCGLVWWESSSGRFGFLKRITETVREEKSGPESHVGRCWINSCGDITQVAFKALHCPA